LEDEIVCQNKNKNVVWRVRLLKRKGALLALAVQQPIRKDEDLKMFQKTNDGKLREKEARVNSWGIMRERSM
jgi:hypothetical protein